MADSHHGVNIAAGVEIGLKLHPNRIRCGHQIIEDPVCHFFMGDGAVAVTVHVELDRLELHHPRTRLVNQTQHCKIRIAREWALTGEFRQLNRHLIRAPRARVVETDQLRLANRAFAIQGGLGLLFCQRNDSGI